MVGSLPAMDVHWIRGKDERPCREILTFYNAIANNGTMVKPIFVEEMHSHGKVVKKFRPEVLINHILFEGEHRFR